LSRETFDSFEERSYEVMRFFIDASAKLVLTDDHFELEAIVESVKKRFFHLKEQVVDKLEFIFQDAHATKIEEESEDSHLQNAQSHPQDPALIPTDTKHQEYFQSAEKKIESLKEQTGQMETQRVGLIKFQRVCLKQLSFKKWIKPAVSLLIKDIFFNKEGIFNPNQTEQLEEFMENLNDAILSSQSTPILM
jgi:hypothetical protein